MLTFIVTLLLWLRPSLVRSRHFVLMALVNTCLQSFVAFFFLRKRFHNSHALTRISKMVLPKRSFTTFLRLLVLLFLQFCTKYILGEGNTHLSALLIVFFLLFCLVDHHMSKFTLLLLIFIIGPSNALASCCFLLMSVTSCFPGLFVVSS